MIILMRNNKSLIDDIVEEFKYIEKDLCNVLNIKITELTRSIELLELMKRNFYLINDIIVEDKNIEWDAILKDKLI
jgi:hypothetical protein